MVLTRAEIQRKSDRKTRS